MRIAMTLSNWWKIQRPLPPFEVSIKQLERKLVVHGLKVYAHGIWFYDSISEEYLNGESLIVVKAPYFGNISEIISENLQKSTSS